jgi:hypothetical protein
LLERALGISKDENGSSIETVIGNIVERLGANIRRNRTSLSDSVQEFGLITDYIELHEEIQPTVYDEEKDGIHDQVVASFESTSEIAE